MPQRVRGDVLVPDRRAGLCCSGSVPGDEPLNGVTGEPAAGLGGEQRPGGTGIELGEPGPHDLDGPAGERGCPVFPALAVAADVGPGPEVDVLPVQAGELGDPQPGLDGEQEQGPVASAVPAPAVGCGDEGVGLLGGQVADDRALAPSWRDGQDLADDGGVLGCLRGRVLEQRVDRGQAGVAGGAAVAPLLFQVVEEPADQGGVEVGEAELGGLLPAWPEAKASRSRQVSR